MSQDNTNKCTNTRNNGPMHKENYDRSYTIPKNNISENMKAVKSKCHVIRKMVLPLCLKCATRCHEMAKSQIFTLSCF